jgi:PAS domain S-box-containing protein
VVSDESRQERLPSSDSSSARHGTKRTATLDQPRSPSETEADLLAPDLFSRIFLDSPEAVSILDLGGRYLAQNRAHAGLVGYSYRELETETLATVLGPETFDRVIQSLHRTGRFSGVVDCRTKSGRRLQVQLTVHSVEDQSGRTLCYVSHTLDMTEVFEARDNAQRERAALDRILNLNPYGIGIFDEQGRFVRANQAFLDLFGAYPPPHYSIFSDRLLTQAGFDPQLDLLRQGQAVTFPGLPYNPSRADPSGPDRELVIRSVGFPITSSRGEINYVLMYEDISEQTLAEQSLRDSEERFRNLTETAFDGIMIHEGGRILDVNTKMADMFGYRQKEMIDLSLFDLVPDDYVDAMGLEVETGHEESIFLEARRRDGSTFPAELVGRACRYRDRDVMVMAVRDLSGPFATEAALRRERDFNQTLIDFSPTFMVVMDRAGKIVLMNRTMLQATGLDPAHVRGANYLDVCAHPDERRRLLKSYRTAVKNQQPIREESTVITADGRNLIVQWQGQPLFKADGDFDHFFAAGLDITRRRRVEKQLETERETFLSILNRLPYGIVLIEADGHYGFANEAFTELTGFTLEDVPTGRDWFERAYPDPEYRRQAIEVWQRELPSGIEEQTFTVTCRDQTQKELTFRPMMFENKRSIMTVFDVTDRRRAEAALRESEERFRSLSENAPDLIATMDLEGSFTYVNPAWKKLLGHERHEVLGRYFIDFVRVEDAPEYVRVFKRVFQGEETVTGHKGILIHTDGSLRRFELSGSPNFDSEGNVTGVVLVAADTTEQSRLEEQLRHAQKMEAVGTLAGGVSHDLNNVLHAISGYAQLLLHRKDLDDPDWHHLQLLNRSVERGAELVKQLLTFSRKVEANMRPVDVNAEIEDVRRLLERTIPRMIQIETRLDPDLLPIQADPAQIEQILMNLGSNARDAMPEGGTLLFVTANFHLEDDSTLTRLELDSGHYVKLTISDTGQGMDAETLDKIFEPFFTTKGFADGTGLGLSTVYGIVKNHGGHIACRSAPDQGATFDIYLPAWELDDDQARTAGPEPYEVPGGTETILLVDDEPAVLEIGTTILGEYGYQTLTADCGELAVEMVREGAAKIDLVVLDLSMPGMGGHKCLPRLLSLDPDLKVIIASGYSSDAQIKETLEAGAAAFLGKPYRLTELLAAVRRTLDQARV